MSSSADPVADWEPPALARVRPRGGGRAGPDGAWLLPELTASGRSATPTAGRGDEQVQEAYQRGHDAGLEEGAARVEERLRTALEALRRAAEALSASREQRLRDLEANVYAIALTAARKVVMREIAVDPSIVAELVRHARGMLENEGPLEIRLHPEDVNLIRSEGPSAGGDPEAEVRLTADPTVERGSFVLNGPQRIIEGRADEALRRLYEKLCHE